MSEKDKAIKYFKDGYNCSQAVIAAYSDKIGADVQTLLKLSAPFGAGFGGTRGKCGALVGATMVSSMLNADTNNSFNNKKEIYQDTREITKEFAKIHGSAECAEILKGVEHINTLSAPNDRTDEYYQKRPCLKIVENSCYILDSFIASKA